MAKKRQVPRLFAVKTAAGNIWFHWKPERRLRQLGWKNHALGADQVAATRAALDLNAQVEAVAAPAAPGPKKSLTFGELVAAYQASTEYLGATEKTRTDYDLWLTWLEQWALDGALPVDAIDKTMVRDLKAALLDYDANGIPRGSVHKCAAILRVLRLLCKWGVAYDHLAANPQEGVEVPTPRARQVRLEWPEVEAAAALALAGENPDATAALALRVGFWSVQRQGDMLRQFTQLNWREVENVDPLDRPLLANEAGKVMGFRVVQSKTGMVLHVPLPPFLHAEIEARFKRSQYLFPQHRHPDKPANVGIFHKAVRAALDAAGHPGVQGRDMRRSGMTWMEEMGASESRVLCLSGHSVPGDRKIVGVYMPQNTRKACAGLADCLRGMADRKARREAQSS